MAQQHNPFAKILHDAQERIAHNDQRGAIKVLKSGVKKHAKSPEIHIALGRLYDAFGQRDESMAAFAAGVEKCPPHAELYDCLGVCHLQRRQWEKGLEYCGQAVKLDPSNADYAHHMGEGFLKTGKFDHARLAFEMALQMKPDHLHAKASLAEAFGRLERYDEAMALFNELLELKHNEAHVHFTIGVIEQHRGNIDAAIEHYEKSLAINPNNESITYMLQTLRNETADAPPEEYVKTLFDDYASYFDQSLTGKLQYKTPTQMLEALKETVGLPDEPTWKVMDLGAGTGLFGMLIKEYAAESIGNDLSPKMLEKAEQKGIYTKTICGDLVKAMAEYDADYFDLISSADVFVYLGNLDTTFEQASRTLKPEAAFVFSVESLDARIRDGIVPDGADKGKGFVVQDTARYAHAQSYIENLADKHGFDIKHLKEEQLRQNNDLPIWGYVVILQKRAA